MKIQNFTDLEAWKEAHNLVLETYNLTKKFPSEEKFSLIDQMRRCAISITSNIAEGFSRQSKKDKLRFYSMAKGSLTELQNQLILSKDIKYINEKEYNPIFDQTFQVSRLLTGLIRYCKS